MSHLNIKNAYKNSIKGFTLIELMIVLLIIAIIAAVAFPSYNAYARKAAESLAQQEMQKIAEQLERHRSKNFTYRGFDPNYIYDEPVGMTSITLPRGVTGDAIRYTITIRDGVNTTQRLDEVDRDGGRTWAIRAEASDVRAFSLLMTSTGIKCKNRSTTLTTYTSCDTPENGGGTW